jgi:hypothetical protein
MNASGRGAQHAAVIQEPFDATSLCTSLAPPDEWMVVMHREVAIQKGTPAVASQRRVLTADRR